MLMTKRKPIPVGEILTEEFMQPMGLTQTALAKAMGVQRKHVNELCNDRRNVTAPTAGLPVPLCGDGGPRQCLRVNILLDVRYFAISNGNVEDPLVPIRLIRSIDFSRSDADDQNPVSLRHEFGGRWVFHFHLFGRLLKHSRQFRVPAVRACERPALARNDPLNIFGNQRQQIVLIVAAYCCKEILHNLDILFDAH
jgi:transcriptional regulator with XRE-family HTH domain